MSAYENGVIGLGSRTTTYYINEINRQFNDKKGGYNTFPFLLINANFHNINPYLPNQYKKINEELVQLIKKAKQIGLSKIIFPNITIYETLYEFPYLSKDIKVIDPITEVITLIDKSKPILVVGSEYTSNSTNLAKRFKEDGFKVNTNESSISNWINDFRIRVYHEKETLQDTEEFNELIDSLALSQSVLIACTELSTVLQTKNNNVFDMVDIQIKAFIK